MVGAVFNPIAIFPSRCRCSEHRDPRNSKYCLGTTRSRMQHSSNWQSVYRCCCEEEAMCPGLKPDALLVKEPYFTAADESPEGNNNDASCPELLAAKTCRVLSLCPERLPILKGTTCKQQWILITAERLMWITRGSLSEDHFCRGHVRRAVR